MPGELHLSFGKFIFRVPADRWYTPEGVWASQEGPNVIRVGLSDFLQQRSGDVAFAEAAPLATRLAIGETAGRIETIKVNISIGSPVSGTVFETNPVLGHAPERINEDPYGEGWLILVETANWEKDRANLLDAQAYLDEMKRQIEAENKTP